MCIRTVRSALRRHCTKHSGNSREYAWSSSSQFCAISYTLRSDIIHQPQGCSHPQRQISSFPRLSDERLPLCLRYIVLLLLFQETAALDKRGDNRVKNESIPCLNQCTLLRARLAARIAKLLGEKRFPKPLRCGPLFLHGESQLASSAFFSV